MEEVLAILMSLKPDVTKFGESAFAESVVTYPECSATAPHVITCLICIRFCI